MKGEHRDHGRYTRRAVLKQAAAVAGTGLALDLLGHRVARSRRGH